ncbi:hypothetical protein NLX67_07700 [Domibacillus sp. A3M-37]|uniref:hypothetical protein n=1 Tax=Domibacillus sp. A3M-37 TaxID=2962037 RepID=UPI0020B783AD|nr:hypothetical protein [Domibacillus sp. A3M-37]MCP3762271.1 hypothetical protein [Domibacillus sp. A3M-37]
MKAKIKIHYFSLSFLFAFGAYVIFGNILGDDHLLKVDGIVSECSRLPVRKQYSKLEGYSSKDEIVSIHFAAGDDYGVAIW